MNDILDTWHSANGELSLSTFCTCKKKSLFADQDNGISRLNREQSVMITSVTIPQMEINIYDAENTELVAKYQTAAEHFSNFYNSAADYFIQSSFDNIGIHAIKEAKNLFTQCGAMAMYTFCRFDCRCTFSPSLTTECNSREPIFEVIRHTLLLRGGNTVSESRDTLSWKLSNCMWDCRLKTQ